MVHYIFWLFSGGAPASQLAKRGGFPKPPGLPAAAWRSSSPFVPSLRGRTVQANVPQKLAHLVETFHSNFQSTDENFDETLPPSTHTPWD